MIPTKLSLNVGTALADRNGRHHKCISNNGTTVFHASSDLIFTEYQMPVPIVEKHCRSGSALDPPGRNSNGPLMMTLGH